MRSYVKLFLPGGRIPGRRVIGGRVPTHPEVISHGDLRGVGECDLTGGQEAWKTDR